MANTRFKIFFRILRSCVLRFAFFAFCVDFWPCVAFCVFHDCLLRPPLTRTPSKIFSKNIPLNQRVHFWLKALKLGSKLFLMVFKIQNNFFNYV
ncbi:unnamed protein product [Meloidogyne enterolobii]|uniref:Uncharacterized protein n=1 Tax=Meloidogyne enterolobii TaxID=390850 RepID=A0ACB1AHY1_MELEN